ncbi:hypothetical protein HanRHA438_Chr06g0282101 [Helianthus annuus]|nr:hypothetical protein HanRHA438_Chr06g0282101 [Helianthus annuus]
MGSDGRPPTKRSQVRFLILAGFYRSCTVVPSRGCRVGFCPKLVAWWARDFVHAE